jgi:tetratricopeptide (TPR) repeat protein
MVLWTLSFFLFKAALPGTVGIIAVVLLGVFLCRWGYPLRKVRFGPGPLLIATVLAAGLGIWQFGGIELPVRDHFIPPDKHVDYSLLTDRHRDVGFHLHITSVIASSGLPRLNLYGVPDTPYHSLAHFGYAVSLAGVSHLTGMSFYEACSCLWVVGYLVLVWSAFAFLTRMKIATGWTLIGSLSPLLWAGVGVPPLGLLIHPETVRSAPGIPFPAGNLYHNFPHLWSVAIMGVALVCLDRFLQSSGQSKRTLAAATLAVVASGWIKPSLFILYAPALIICLAWNRRKLIEWTIVIGVLCAGVFVYFLPAALVSLPSQRTWSVSPSSEQSARVAWYFCLGLGGGFLLLVARMWSCFKGRDAVRLLDAGDLMFIAAAGSALFGVTFREGRHFSGQPNLWWGPAGCLALLAPYLVAWYANAPELNKRASVNVWLRRVGGLVVGLHLLNGVTYAAAYPLLNVRFVQISHAQVLEVARQNTTAKTRLYVDPILDNPDLMAYIARPVIYSVAGLDKEALAELKNWDAFMVDGHRARMRSIDLRDAAILHSSRSRARSTLQQFGWSMERELPNDFQLWLNQDREAAPRDGAAFGHSDANLDRRVNDVLKLPALANELRRQGRIDEAIGHLRKFLEAFPTDVHIHTELGRMYAARGGNELALRHCQIAVENQPERPDLRLNLAFMLQRMGKLEQAVGQYRYMLKIRPDNAEAHSRLGEILLGLGEREAALRHFHRALRIKPDFTHARQHLDRALRDNRAPP